MSLLILLGNRDTVDKSSGGGVPYATAQRNKVGVEVRRRMNMLHHIARKSGAPMLALRKVLLNPLHSFFKLVGFYQNHVAFWLDAKLQECPLRI